MHAFRMTGVALLLVCVGCDAAGGRFALEDIAANLVEGDALPVYMSFRSTVECSFRSQSVFASEFDVTWAPEGAPSLAGRRLLRPDDGLLRPGNPLTSTYVGLAANVSDTEIPFDGCDATFTESVFLLNVVEGSPVDQRVVDLEDLIQAEWDARGRPFPSSSEFADRLLDPEP